MLEFIKNIDYFAKHGNFDNLGLSVKEIDYLYSLIGFGNSKGIPSSKRFEYKKAFLKENLEYLYKEFDCKNINSLYNNLECSDCLPIKLKKVDVPKIVKDNIDVVKLLSKYYRECTTYSGVNSEGRFFVRDLVTKYLLDEKISSVRSKLKKDVFLLDFVNKITPKVKVIDNSPSFINGKFMYLSRDINKDDYSLLKYYALLDSITANLSIPFTIRSIVIGHTSFPDLYLDSETMRSLTEYSLQSDMSIKEIYNRLGFSTFDIKSQIETYGVAMLPLGSDVQLLVPQCKTVYMVCSKDVVKYLFDNNLLDSLEEYDNGVSIDNISLESYLRDVGVEPGEISFIRYRGDWTRG